MQSTWDISRRLRKWEDNQYKFGNGSGQKAKPTVNQQPTPTLKTIQ
jgi:hypothetical protein